PLHVTDARGRELGHGHSHRRERHRGDRRKLPLERAHHRERKKRRHSLPRRRQSGRVRCGHRERAQPARGREPRGRYRGQTGHSIQQRGSRPRSERAPASSRDNPELDRSVSDVSIGIRNSGKFARTSPQSGISSRTTLRPGLSAPRPGSNRSTVWWAAIRNPPNVVDGKILAPPPERALYYIANREKGV